MDKDRIEGSATQVKGSIKEAAGKVTGDSKLKAEGAADKAARARYKMPLAVAKDAVRDAIGQELSFYENSRKPRHPGFGCRAFCCRNSGRTGRRCRCRAI